MPSSCLHLAPVIQQAQPLRRSLRLVSKCASSLRLASGPVPQPACWRVLRVCDWPSGPSVYETGLAHPATRPSTAQPSPPSPSSRRNQQRSPAARQPTHDFVAETAGSAQRARSGSCLRLASGQQLRQLLSLSEPPQSGCPSSSAQAGQALTSCSSQQLATQIQAQVCMRQALPIQRPAQAQPKFQAHQQRRPAAQQPATETSFRPNQQPA